MDEAPVIEEAEEDPGDRLSASVQHALRLVGPAEGGAERHWLEAPRTGGRAPREV